MNFVFVLLMLTSASYASSRVANIEYSTSAYIDDTVYWLKRGPKFIIKTEAPVVWPNVKQGIFFKQYRYSYSNTILTIGSLSNNLRLSIYSEIKNNRLLKNAFPFDCRESHKGISQSVKNSCDTLMKFYNANGKLDAQLHYAVKNDIDFNTKDYFGSFKMNGDDTQQQRDWDAYYDERESNEVFNLNSSVKDIIGLPVVVGNKNDNVIPIPKNIRTKKINLPKLGGPDVFPAAGDKLLSISCNEVEKLPAEKWSRRYEFQCIGGKVLLKSRSYFYQKLQKCSDDGKSEGDVWKRYSNGVTKSSRNSSTDYLYYDIATCVEGEIVEVRSMLWTPKQCSDYKKSPGDKWWTLIDQSDLTCPGYSACGPGISKRQIEGAWECNAFGHIIPSSDKSFVGPGLVSQQILIDNQTFVQYMRLGDFLTSDCKLINPDRKVTTDPVCLPFTLPFQSLGSNQILNYYKTKSFTPLTGDETASDSVKKEGKLCKAGHIIFYKCGEKPSGDIWKLQPDGKCYQLETNDTCTN